MPAGSRDVYADVGSIADGEDVSYDKNGGVLASLGFDTSKMPDTYDPDATTNPYGSDVSNLSEVDEGLIFDLSDSDEGDKSLLYGHNKKLNGDIGEFLGTPRDEETSFIKRHDFVNAVKLDINGDGRDSAVAIVYTDYYRAYYSDPTVKNHIYMCLYDPVSGTHSDSVEIAVFDSFLGSYNFQVQSQLQITAGDFDKDSVDEIAVYAPTAKTGEANKVKVFDLTDGKECSNPYDISAWTNSWNYVLPYNSQRTVWVLIHTERCQQESQGQSEIET